MRSNEADKNQLIRKTAALILLTLVLSCGITFAAPEESSGKRFFAIPIPEPYLLSPTKENIDLTGKKELEFKWDPHEQGLGFRQYYDFRLYKGRNEYADSLIFKKQVPPDEYQIKVPSEIFKDGQVYTWALRQVYDQGKSPRSYYSFKVFKK